MPSTIAPIDATRASSVRPAQGLRYGNFEGVRNLPPVRKSDALSEHNFWAINNEHICDTVCQWMESWQPWQQRTLLCGVANRDYKTQALCRYPSAPFKVNKPNKEKRKKKPTKEARSAKSIVSQKIPLIVTDDSGNVTDVKTITGFQKQKDTNASEPNKKFSKEQNKNLPKPAEERKSSSSFENNISTDEKDEEHHKSPIEAADVPMGMDQYASLLSSSILISALNEATAVSMYDKFQFSNSREASSASNGRVQIEEPNETGTKSKARPVSSRASKLKSRPTTRSSQVSSKSSASKLKSRPTTRSSQVSSTRFLGGTLEFSTDDHYWKYRRERSCSSLFRHSAFAPSVASTTDFFNKKKVSKLGPMQHTLRTGSVQKPLHLGPLPVPLQRYYKNARWWPAEPPSGTVYHHVRKQELALNFNEQLSAIWKWLSEWESYEQIAFIKKVAMMCPASVLDALLTHIQQRLRDTRDINRLPDKLLLYVFSFLPPQDILQAAKVCRRWRFLCAMDELWMLKCIEIGEQGGVSNIGELVQQAREDADTCRTTHRDSLTVAVPRLDGETTSRGTDKGSHASSHSRPDNVERVLTKPLKWLL
ncbi:hypothetical protein EGW08_006570 [Elysia chlorotica]|uniref:F-box domain-containing protein n=1 Tax=Elysia chlorotica TaxID=188477 RepID=A0A3S1C883_ELYCH|nr:hypothetical protein EGW08_006570 [Elysia chlorotica]